MNEVFKKTRELGEAIMKSDEYATMKAAEETAMKNETAALTMAAFIEKKQELENLMSEDKPSASKLKDLSEQVELINEKLQAIDDIASLMSARGEFSRLINQVNQVLRFIITGEMEDSDDEGGCGHHCDSCGGCQSRVLH